MKALTRSGLSQEDAAERIADKTAIHELDKPRTYKDAACQLGVGYPVIQRAARRGLVPTYQLGSSRRYVKLRDLVELMTRDTKPLMGE
jgi:hypothetical protein